MTELQQTKSSFKLIGFATRLEKDNTYKEEVAQKGKREGENFRALRFGIKTSDTNEITVSSFDYEPTEVFMWNSDKKKKDANYKGDRIPFETWLEQEDELREQGYAVLQSRVGLTYDDKGKVVSKGLPSYVASKEIYNNLDNGDAVVVEGEIRYSTYENGQGETVEQKTHTIKKIFKLKELDFEDAKYEEISFFEQQMVFVDADHDKKEGKVYVTGRIIDYMKNYHDTQMIVRYKDGEGNVDEGMKKLAENISSKIKFGDVITVYGDILNRVILKEVEEEDDDDLFANFGGKQKPKKAQTFTARTYISEMSIYGVEAVEKGVYKEDDFTDNDLIAKKESKSQSEFGGKAKKTNPFASDDDGVDIDDEELPF